MNVCVSCGRGIGLGSHCADCGRHCLNCGTVNSAGAKSCRLCSKMLFLKPGVKPKDLKVSHGKGVVRIETKPPDFGSYRDPYGQSMRFVLTGRQVWLMMDGIAFAYITAEEWQALGGQCATD